MGCIFRLFGTRINTYKKRNIKPTELHRNNLFLRLMYADRAVMKKDRPVVWDRWYNINKGKRAKKGIH